MNYNTVTYLALLSAILSACAPTAASRLNQMSTEDRVAAGTRTDIKSANISTVEFKELGETARHGRLSGFIKTVWNENCNVRQTSQIGYMNTGESRWVVKCEISTGAYDYQVLIPERKTNPVRVQQCHDPRPGITECSILGRPKKDRE